MTRHKAVFTDWAEHAEPPPRLCDEPGCEAAGTYRAPVAPDRLDEYYWFCLEHVRAYNRAWNYFADMAEDELEAFLRAEAVGHRPTWPLGALGSVLYEGLESDRVRDDLGVLGGRRRRRWRQREDDREAGERRRRSLTPEERAMRIMDLVPPVTLAELKIRYKELVKQYHPDTNGGDKNAEESLKRINQAYKTLYDSLRA